MKKVIIILLLLINSNIFMTKVFATTILAIVSQNQIVLVSDSRGTETDNKGEFRAFSNIQKIFKLKNNVMIGFAGYINENNICACTKHKISFRNVSSIASELDSMKNISELNIYDTIDIVARIYSGNFKGEEGEVIIAGYDSENKPVISLITFTKNSVFKTKIDTFNVGGFSAIGSGASIAVDKMYELTDARKVEDNSKLVECIAALRDSEIEKLAKDTVNSVIKEYQTSYVESEQTTGGEVKILTVKSLLIQS